MIDLKKAPTSGIIYALYPSRIEFSVYENTENLNIAESELLELHLFDSDKEYRAIRSEQFGLIETILEDKTIKHDDTYEEKVFIEDKFNSNGKVSKITVVNYICYNDSDMLTISNYRLKKGE